MKINWTVRIKNKVFWVTAVPAVFIFIQSMAKALGIELNLTEQQTMAMNVVEVIFTILTALGVVVDATTKGLNDSARALTYEEPAE